MRITILRTFRSRTASHEPKNNPDGSAPATFLSHTSSPSCLPLPRHLAATPLLRTRPAPSIRSNALSVRTTVPLMPASRSTWTRPVRRSACSVPRSTSTVRRHAVSMHSMRGVRKRWTVAISLDRPVRCAPCAMPGAWRGSPPRSSHAKTGRSPSGYRRTRQGLTAPSPPTILRVDPYHRWHARPCPT